jgi:hypothetical protein
MVHGDGNFRDKLIDLGDLYLQKLSFTADASLHLLKIPVTQLVCVEIKGRRQYFKVRTGEIPKTIKNEEGDVVWGHTVITHVRLIMCNVPVRFEMNNCCIELMIR